MVGKQDQSKKEIIGEILKRYKKEDYVRGIILNLDAGLEFYILVDRENMERERKEFLRKTEIKINIISIEQAAKKIFRKLSRKLIRDFSNGSLLYSNKREVSLIKSYAREIRKQKFSFSRANWQILWRWHLAQLLKGIEKSMPTDELLALLLMNFTFYKGLFFYSKINGWYEKEGIKTLWKLKIEDEFLYQLCKEYLHESYRKEKFKILKKVISYILEPYGGFLPPEWEIPIRVEGIYLEEEMDIEDLLRSAGGRGE
ncbi:hypothetical protein KAT51_07485 [bacterium]|nr:hypothetical protein [bacterium]